MLNYIASQLAGLFIADVRNIVETLYRGKKRGREIASAKARGHRWKLIFLENEKASAYLRACDECISRMQSEVKENERLKIEVLPSDRGKKRAVYNCESCGKAATKNGVMKTHLPRR